MGRMPRLTALIIAVLVASGCTNSDSDDEAERRETAPAEQSTDGAPAESSLPPDIPAIIARLDDDDEQERESAAEKLAEIEDVRIPDALRERLAVEDDFQVTWALQYALASHGDREALQELIDLMSDGRGRHPSYLRRATDKDFGTDVARWQKWIDATSEADFREIIERRWRRRPMMEEFSEFAGLFFKQDRGDPMTEEEIRRFSELPTTKAWNLFENAIAELVGYGDRKAAAYLFRKIATEFSNTYYADQSAELADLLDEMVIEDAQHTPSDDVESMGLEEQIAFHIHNLRDVEAYQMANPGRAHVLIFQDDDSAALALTNIGEPAIPQLIELLDDRRPICAVGYWRSFHPERTILRYQDAAIQIIDGIRGGDPHEPRSTGVYFSTLQPEDRQEVIEALRATIDSE